VELEAVRPSFLPISEIRLPTGYSPLIDESIYTNFERKDMRLPDINSTKSTATHSTNKGRKINLPDSVKVDVEPDRRCFHSPCVE
jgi:hypothetical protein